MSNLTRPLTNPELSSILSASNKCSALESLYIHLILKTGLRASEALAIRIKDIDLTRNLILVHSRNTKSKRTRLIPLHSTLQERLSRYLESTYQEPHLPLFRNFRGECLSRVWAHKLIKHICLLSGVDPSRVANHSFRKSFAHKAYGFFKHDLIKTQKALGHSSIQSTIHYLQPDQEEINQAFLAD